jgi:hypothetical protein
MSIFTVSYSFVWESLYPPLLRKAIHLAWGTVITKPLQWFHDAFFISYADGTTDLDYNNATAYVIGDRVIFTDRGQYEATAAGTGNLPSNTAFWLKVNDNYIGLRERTAWNSQKIIFESALNRWFQTTGIFITNNLVISDFFLMGNTGELSSTMTNDSAIAGFYMGNAFVSSTTGNYTIFVPLAKFNSLAGNDVDRENIIRNFADIYNLAGLIYDVETF